jgi:hypothetical protein
MGSLWVVKKASRLESGFILNPELLHSRVSGRCGWKLRRFKINPGRIVPLGFLQTKGSAFCNSCNSFPLC